MEKTGSEMKDMTSKRLFFTISSIVIISLFSFSFSIAGDIIENDRIYTVGMGGWDANSASQFKTILGEIFNGFEKDFGVKFNFTYFVYRTFSPT